MPRQKQLNPTRGFSGLIKFLTTDLRNISDPTPLYVLAFAEGRQPRILYAVGIPPGDVKDQIQRVQEKGNALLDGFLKAEGPIRLDMENRTRRKATNLPVRSLWEPMKRRVEELISLCRDPELPTLPLRRCSECHRPFAAAKTAQSTCSTACRNRLSYKSRRVRLSD